MTRILILLTALAPAAFLAVGNGCTPSTDLGGVRINNALPDTRITGTPPVLDETDIVVQFFWSGSDPDGNIKGYEWKMTSNGVDGISVLDTLTVDPATGDTLNPWFFTHATDTTFIVTADSSGFLGDSYLPDYLQRFSQAHTLFVRTVDDDDEVDPSPAMITFTATTLAPTIQLSTPEALKSGYSAAMGVPPTFIMGWTGSDPDFETNSPVRMRYLFKEAVIRNEGEEDLWINTEYGFNTFKDELISFSDPEWSDWIAYEDQAIDRRATFTQAPSTEDYEKYYLFAMQAQDTAGAVSLDLSYARTVHNFRIDDTKTPSLTVIEEFLGESQSAGIYGVQRADIAQNQPLSFTWFADADDYGGLVEAYRYGWDVDDLTNDADPGWEVQFGNSDAHRESGLKTFDSGIHTLVVEARDNSGQLSRFRYVLTVVPVPAPADQWPVLLVDDVPDKTSNGWPNRTYSRAYDRDEHRDEYWNLALSSVDRWSAGVDVIDCEDSQSWGYREAVNYGLLLWTTKKATTCYITSQFVSDNTSQAFVWLETYMSNVGNVFMVGEGAMHNFHPVNTFSGGTQWLFPVIYDTDEANALCNNLAYALSFGTRRDEDDNVIVRGREQFPYRTMGLSMTNQMVPSKFWRAANVCGDGGFDHTRRCGGTKAIVIDAAFKNNHLGAVEFPDTIYTWSQVDWADDTVSIPLVEDNFDFGGNDEFYDVNVTSRTTNWSPQRLRTGAPAIEPMWRAYTRYDWILDQHLAQGATDFPGDVNMSTQAYCGVWGLDLNTGRSRNDGVPIGVLSYQTAETKPSGIADVLWGFDPHRLEHDESIAAVHWVLEEHFELDLN